MNVELSRRVGNAVYVFGVELDKRIEFSKALKHAHTFAELPAELQAFVLRAENTSKSISKFNENHDERGRFSSSDTPAQLSESQIHYLDQYAGHAYYTVNTYLRSGEDKLQHWQQSTLQEAKDIRDSLDRSFQTVAPLTTDQVVYRGIGPGKFADTINSLQVGDRFTDTGFISTSESLRNATGFLNDNEQGALLRIEVPAGEKVIDVNKEMSATGSTHEYHYEKEILLNRDTTFEVTHQTPAMTFVKVVPNGQ